MAEGQILVEKSGAVGYITIDNPERRNAINGDMWRGFSNALTNLDADDEVRAVVLRGSGASNFSSGGDIAEMDKHSGRPGGDLNVAIDAFKSFDIFRKPLIAAIRGNCLGAGVAISMKADIRIAARSSRFGIPAARIGVGYLRQHAEDLIRETSPSIARMIIFSADRYSADEALSMGLINRVVEDDDFQAEVAAYSARIAANAPLTLNLFKRVTKRAEDEDYTALDDAIAACMDSEDFAEGRRAFLEKRTPCFKGC